MTNFRPVEFIWKEYLLEFVTSEMWNIGPGKRSTYTPLNVQLSTLTVYENGGAEDFLPFSFKIKSCAFQRTVTNFVE